MPSPQSPSELKKRTPIPIHVPTNRPSGQNFKSQTSGQNPFTTQYSKKRTVNEDVGNPTSKRILTNRSHAQEQGPPSKRRKISNSASSMFEQGSSKGRIFKPPPPPLAPDDEEPTYDVDSDDAHAMGKQSSPDPLNSLFQESGPSRISTKHRSSINSRSNKAKPITFDETDFDISIIRGPDEEEHETFDEADYDLSTIRGTSTYVPIIIPDGNDTAWARKRFQTAEDPIEDSSDSSFSKFPGTTASEQNNLIDPPLKIDLASKLKKTPGVARSMKGKNQRVPLPFEPIGRLTSNTDRRQEGFAIEEAYVGEQLHKASPGQKLDMYLDQQALRIIANDTTLLDIPLTPPEHCKEIIFTDSYSAHFPPVIQLKKNDTVLTTIRLDKKWDQLRYNQLRSTLRVKKEQVISTGINPLWQYATAGAPPQNALLNLTYKEQQEERIRRSLSLTYAEREQERIKRNAAKLAGWRTARNGHGGDVPYSGNILTIGSRGKETSSTRQEEVLKSPVKPRPIARPEPRRSMRNTPSKEQPDELILVYPPGPGAVNINISDLNRLEPGEYLNDTLIEFGLKLWLNKLETKNPQLAHQIHIFNSFFYKKLNQGKDIQQTFENIRKWTSKIDIFEKKYIIVPINENLIAVSLHWYLAIICEPKYILYPKTPKSSASRKQTRSTVQPSVVANTPAASEDKDDQTVTSSEAEVERNLNNEFQSSCVINGEGVVDSNLPIRTAVDEHDANSLTSTVSAANKVEDGVFSSSSHASRPVFERNELQSLERSPSASESRMSVDSIEEIDEDLNRRPISTEQFYQSHRTDRHWRERAPREPDILVLDDSVNEVVNDEPVEETFIFIMDSLGTKHRQAVNKLTAYLKLEAKDKKGVSDAGTAKSKLASVPVQPNFCDCGVYLLHFAQTFMSNPVKYSQSILTQKSNNIPNHERQKIWNDSEVAGMRVTLAEQIRRLADEWKKAKSHEMQNDEGKQDNDDDDEVKIVHVQVEGKNKGAKLLKTPARRLR
ncbi:Ubiquitin-like-specific protease 2 [Psilocybe cubensis]|uniref:Ubiquitin-like-specific protease 2 n=2 Tax=Psilocybe cubensis TaxID=181762 RepID=A0ACB8GYB8_PSICU|nr:Ubiquitin-like-specific protease 2 [Psilocybe cubensis]KAH9480523.1 Ubiquitin-like-specific protease 2 [Psilocybe cubensis]